MRQMTQTERLDYLVEAFKKDSGTYRDLQVEPEPEAKRVALRSLMNIRMPGEMAPEVLAVQDAYLRERNAEKGVVSLENIPTVWEQYGSAMPFADRISIWQGDITCLAVDAIVNAANSQMLGCFQPMHTCIDNCIHTFAGVQLRLECARQMNRKRIRYGRDYEQPTAQPMLTDAYNLPAKKIIHVTGPIVYGALTEALERELADCYRNVLDMCIDNGLRSVAFCCISTGVFMFPKDRAAEIAVATVLEYLNTHQDSPIQRVIFNVFSAEDYRIYDSILN